MNQTFLEVRETHRYVGTWSHLDAWTDIGTARITPFRRVREGRGDPSDGGTLVAFARIPRGQDRDASKRALTDTFSKWGCSHEHDCCGCRSTSAEVLPISQRKFLIRQHVTYNY